MHFYYIFLVFQLIKTYPSDNECKYVNGICKEVSQDNSILLPIKPVTFTKFYNKNIINKGKKYFFDDRTFGINIYLNPCEKIDTSKFRRLINQKIKCEGELCINGDFSWSKDRKCYEVDHIIDIGGPEYGGHDNPSKNIAANYVMIHKTWNRALGGRAAHWYGNSANEKLTVFGQLIMDKIRNKIKECQEKIKSKRDDYNDTDTCKQDCECDYAENNTDCGCDCEEIEEDFYPVNLMNKIPDFFPMIGIGLFMIGTLFGCFIYFIYAKYNKKSEDLQEYEIENI